MTSVTEIRVNDESATLTQSSASPLTTFLTPNADCTDPSAYESTYWAGNQWAFQLDSGISKPTCYPSSYSKYQYDSGLWYSPGVCPYSYQYVATAVDSPESGPATTFAICCPPHVYNAPNSGWSCWEVLTTTVKGGLVFSLSDGTTQPATTAYANPISVAWQESDLDKFTPASAPLIALKSQGVTFPTETTTSDASTSTDSTSTTSITSTSTTTGSPSSSSNLSTGAAAGIGVGATIAGLALFAGLWWFLKRYRFTRRSPSHDGTVSQGNPKGEPELAEAPDMAMRLEAPDTVLYEVPGSSLPPRDYNARRAELDGGWRPPVTISGVHGPSPNS